MSATQVLPAQSAQQVLAALQVYAARPDPVAYREHKAKEVMLAQLVLLAQLAQQALAVFQARAALSA